ncbi:tetratricopeptide repeat protein [Salisaeta longa]|uniref:tetratricopeptide repeat protein n=1 Tax=Salisaeta longa TaxID=503170 RepID=UPI0003B68212|nr:tetratricopeptide repeat protein [Salisaeta longa]
MKGLRVAIVLCCGLLASGWPAPVQAQPATAQAEEPVSGLTQRLFVRGMTRAFAEDYSAAIAYYEQALELAPQEAAILSSLSDAHAARGEDAAALHYARKARAAAPGNVFYHAQVAKQLEAMHRWTDAAAAYQTLLQRHPQHQRYRRARAAALAEAGRPHDALAAYEAYATAAQPSVDTWAAMLALYRTVGDTAGIESTLRRLIVRAPHKPRYRNMLGQFYAAHGRTQEAVALYEQLAEQLPHNPEVMTRLASLYRRQGAAAKADTLMQQLVQRSGASADELAMQAQLMYHTALATASPDSTLLRGAAALLVRVLERAPGHNDASYLLGTIRHSMEQYAAAAPLLQDALRADPRHPDDWERAAESFLRAGRPQAALDMANEGLLLFPGQIMLVRTAGSALMALHRDRAALARFQEALDLIRATRQSSSARGVLSSPSVAMIHATIGRLYHRLGSDSLATNAFMRALALDSAHPPVLVLYASVLADRGALGDARQLAQRAVAQQPTNAEALSTLGRIYLAQQRYPKARAVLQRAVAQTDAPAVAFERLGDAYQALNQPAQARHWWKEALRRAPARTTLQEKLQAHRP